MKKFLFAISTLLLVSSELVNAQLIINGEFRPRTEYRNGVKSPRPASGTVPELVTNQRTALGLQFTRNGVTGKFEIQDVRTWGESKPKSDPSTFHLKEGWFEFNITDSITTRLGRQILSYNDERILAKTNWNNIGTQHDVAVFKYQNKAFTSHLGLAYNNDTGGAGFESYYPVSTYKALSLVWMNYKGIQNTDLSFIGVTDWNAKPNESAEYYARYTYGITATTSPVENLLILTNLHLQNGTNRAGQDVNAYLVTVRTDYSIKKDLGIFAGTDIYSGNDPASNPSKTNQFDRLYGAKHKFLGYMDYFPDGNYGIHDIYAGTKFKTGNASTLELTAHAFRLPHDFTNPATGNFIDKYLGTEFDAKFGYKITKEMSFTFVGGVLFAGESMEVVKATGDRTKLNSFFAVYITYKPKFILQ